MATLIVIHKMRNGVPSPRVPIRPLVAPADGTRIVDPSTTATGSSSCDAASRRFFRLCVAIFLLRRFLPLGIWYSL